MAISCIHSRLLLDNLFDYVGSLSREEEEDPGEADVPPIIERLLELTVILR